MRISVQPQLFSTATIVRLLFTALIYAIAIIPTKLLLMLMPGAEVRFAACIPVVAGMMWGPAGAIGSALGNFAADFYTGSSLYICFWGAAANFFWHICHINYGTAYLKILSRFFLYMIPAVSLSSLLLFLLRHYCFLPCLRQLSFHQPQLI